MIKFSELNISDDIVRAVTDLGFEEATEIQSRAIPLILEGKDVLGRSHTGTGKTAAFGIPAIEMVKPNGKLPQVLMICPTRELVEQVATELRKFSKYKEGVKIVPIYGGQPIERQIQLLKRGCGIVVGTPGRIMDHLNRRTLKLKDTKMVVLDEADEMLNMGFKEDIEEILKSMPDTYQMSLFSATMPPAILKITEEFQNDPVSVEVKSAQRTIDTVEQIYYEVGKGKKTNALRLLLQHFDPELTMIFCNTKKMVDELVDELNLYDIKSIGLHGDMKQTVRTRVMDQFRTGNYPILIATDVAARGIDVDNIDLVVNYDIPQDNEYYIHRVGRTGRAGKSGKAVTLISGSKQKQFMKEIVKYTKTNISKKSLPTSEEMKEIARNNFINEVKNACLEGITEEVFEIANDLLAEGIAIENILSALISMNYKPEVFDFGKLEDEPKKKKHKNMEKETIKISIGRKDGVVPGNVVAAISEETGLSSEIIGKIDVRAAFTLVDIEKDYAEKVIEVMNGNTIRNIEVHVGYDKKGAKPKKEESKKEHRRESRKESRREMKRGSSRRREESSKDKKRSRRKVRG